VSAGCTWVDPALAAAVCGTVEGAGTGEEPGTGATGATEAISLRRGQTGDGADSSAARSQCSKCRRFVQCWNFEVDGKPVMPKDREAS